MASNSSKLIPSNPEKVMIIRKLAPEVLTCSVPFFRMGLIKIGGRGTIIKMATGNLAVFSPVALTDSVKRELTSFGNGEIKYITALDQEHHIFVEEWAKAYPSARIIAPETLPALRDKQNYWKIPASNLTLFKSNDRASWSVSEEFDKEFDMEYVSSHANHELVFNHKPSKTLIEADLLFNLPATEQFSRTGVLPTSGIFSRLMCAVQNTRGSAIWQKRMLWYFLSAADRSAFNQSMRRIESWEFERIVPCHGDVLEGNGKGIFQKIMQWHLQAGKKTQ